MSHPKVKYTGDGVWELDPYVEGFRVPLANREGKVVPLSAVVIERDENGHTVVNGYALVDAAEKAAVVMDNYLEAAKRSGLSPDTARLSAAETVVRAYLDALAAGEADTKEGK